MKKPNPKACSTLFVFIVAILILTLAACGQTQPSNTASNTSTLYGSPWVSSIFAGNLPNSQSEAKEDLYTHYSYDYMKSHQDGESSSLIGDAKNELRNAVTSVIKESSTTNDELDQLRVFYNQAADATALQTAGAEEVKPYLKAIADTNSLEELNALLSSEDFPFSPWIDTVISVPDMKSEMCIAIMPRMLFSDIETSTDMYLDTDDPTAATARKQMRYEKDVKVSGWVSMLSIGNADEADETTEQLFELEKIYGKDTAQEKHLYSEYGPQADTIKTFTLDELEAALPNFPIRATLAKYGQDTGNTIMVMYPDWLESFNSIWTEENFEVVRSMTEVKVLAECADFLDPSLFSGTNQRLGKEPTIDDVAWGACDRTDTFSQLLAKTYVEQTLGLQTVDKLTVLSNDLVDAYISLVDKTSWLNATSREKINDKIDNLALNILSPDGGYFDYSELELIPSEQGGTLFSNYLRVKAYNEKCEANLVGQPARASAVWYYMKPTTQNCFYDGVSNSINIFPGFVTSAVYDKEMASEELLGSIGFCIAHEISHAFDYSWSQFDAYGLPNPVFTAEDISECTTLRDKLASCYSNVELSSGKNIDGIKVSAEAMADLSGMQAVVEYGKTIDAFDFKKMFGRFSMMWSSVYPESYIDILLQDVHAPVNSRVNVTVQMTDVFYDAFDVKEENAMYLSPDKRIVIWGESAEQL